MLRSWRGWCVCRAPAEGRRYELSLPQRRVSACGEMPALQVARGGAGHSADPDGPENSGVLGGAAREYTTASLALP
jgi:hypothetical protein